MRHRLLFLLAIAGVLVALASAVYYALPTKAQPPAFEPAANPYPQGIYANGIIESEQGSGSNVNLYAEVSAPVVRVLAREGQEVVRGTPLVALDDTVQAATTRQLEQQAEAARALLDELRAQPRPETLRVAAAQVLATQAAHKTALDAYEKQKHSFELDPGSVSRDALDAAANAERSAQANVDVAQRQFELIKAGAWSYDVRNQEAQYRALSRAAEAARALQAKYVLRAPSDGLVLAINTAVGSYVSPQGIYDTYTQSSNNPLVVMGSARNQLSVRVYVDEILVNRLPPPAAMRAEMSIRGTSVRIPLAFARMQPYVTPKIQLSNQRQERVDVRVLPLVFTFRSLGNVALYPGQLVDVFIASQGGSK